MLPPLGFAATLPVARQRCIHLTAELGAISKRSAASRREAPDSTASITRSRRSVEYGFDIDFSQKCASMTEQSLIQRASQNIESHSRSSDSDLAQRRLLGFENCAPERQAALDAPYDLPRTRTSPAIRPDRKPL